MKRKQIVVLGTNIAGFRAALELKSRVGADHDVIVLANTHKFVFSPSLAWVPFSSYSKEELSFDVRPIYTLKGIAFFEESVTHIDAHNSLVATEGGRISYDYLVIATGAKPNYTSFPFIRSLNNIHTVMNYEEADSTRKAVGDFLEKPGPLLVSILPGSPIYWAAYEFIFNIRRELLNHHSRIQVPLLLVTAEPHLFHFGVGTFEKERKAVLELMRFYEIDWRINTVIERVDTRGVLLSNDETYYPVFTLIFPPVEGIPAIRDSVGLANQKALVEVNSHCQSPHFPNVFSAGLATQFMQVSATPLVNSLTHPGYLPEKMAIVSAKNIEASIVGQPLVELDPNKDAGSPLSIAQLRKQLSSPQNFGEIDVSMAEFLRRV